MKALLFSAIALGAAITILACGDDDTESGTNTATDAGTNTETGTVLPANDSGTNETADAGADANDGSTTPQTINGCTDAMFDQTASAANGGGDFTGFPGVDISFPTGVAPEQYNNHCVKVKVGSSINFSGSFTNHPLVAAGGDTPTPIVNTSAGTSASFTATTAGTFGFECSTHPTLMFGAVRVVP